LASGGNWQALVLELTLTDAFRYRTLQPGAAP
jgi:prolyl oligopeptidase PreP (S9A serine peptidase family)